MYKLGDKVRVLSSANSDAVGKIGRVCNNPGSGPNSIVRVRVDDCVVGGIQDNFELVAPFEEAAYFLIKRIERAEAELKEIKETLRVISVQNALCN